MRRFVASIFSGLLVLALLSPGKAAAGLITGVTGGAVLIDNESVLLDFLPSVNSGGQLDILGQDVIVGKTLTPATVIGDFVGIVTTLTYSSTLCCGQIRFSESIVNETGVAWDDYHLEIIDGTFLSDGLSPFQADIVVNDTSATVTQLSPENGTSITVAGDFLRVDFVFGTPVGPGETLGLHIPLAGLIDTGGTVQITQFPTVAGGEVRASPIPEPATLLLIGSGLVGIGVGARRRNRRK